MDFRNMMTIEKGKRGGQPTIRGMRITVSDILQWLASGMSTQKILKEFPKLLFDQNLSYRIINHI